MSRLARKALGLSIKFLLWGLIALQVLFVGGLIGFASRSDFWRARVEATEQAGDQADRAADLIGRAVMTARTALASEAALPGYAAVFEDPSSCTVTSSGADVFVEGEFHILRGDGSVACTSLRPAGGLPGPGYAKSAWLSEVRGEQGSVVAGPLTDPLTGRRALIIAAPIADVPGALVLSLDLEALGKGLRGQLGHGAGALAFFVSTQDRASEVTRSVGTGSDGVRGTRLGGPVSKGTETADVDGVERIFAEASVPGLDWHVLAGVATSEVYANARAQLRDRLILAGFFCVIVLVVGWTINRRIARPIRALAAAVDEAVHGNLTTEVPSDGPAELARLAARFSSMMAMRAKAESAVVEAYEAERKAADQLRELDELKNAFLLAISHELRTPLTSVVGYASILHEELSSLSKAETAEFAGNIASSARRLERLLMDLLDLDRLTRGVMEPRRRPTDMGELVRRVLEHIAIDGRVEVRIPKGTEANIDPALVERVVENLIVNANKHTPPETPICVRAGRRQGELLITVEDAGQGVPDEMKVAIFEPFRSAHKAEHSPGTGIGLALVAEFAKLHGGRAWVEDRRGGGAAFRVALPAGNGHGTKPVRAKRFARHKTARVSGN